MFKQTALTSIDSYKLGHASQYPEGTTKVYSNFTPRSASYLNVPSDYFDGNIVWFGLQAFLEELNSIWKGTFFDQPVEEITKEFQELVAPFCGPNGFDVKKLEQLHKLGYLPLEIKALPEGSRVKLGVPVLTITNTVPEAYWLPNFLETWMSAELWKASTSATISYSYRKIIEKFSRMTGSSSGFIAWQGHDFSPRGMSGIADAAKSGAGHLLSFTGSDNIPALKLVNDVYNGKATFVAGSVPASEHSTATANILVNDKGSMLENETEFLRRYITEIYPSGVASYVSDSFDYWTVITEIAPKLKDEIMNRGFDSLGLSKVVFRPDSGDPVEIICGMEIQDYTEEATDLEEATECAKEYLVDQISEETPHGELGDSEPEDYFIFQGQAYLIKLDIFWNRHDKQYYYIDEVSVKTVQKVELTPQQKGSVQCLAESFGFTVNEKGFKTICNRVGLIYGDSITPQRAEQILQRLANKGYAADNIVFGIGSYTFQYNTRDTLGFAMKATYVEVGNKSQAIFKEPKTDNGAKKSAKGLLRVNGFSGNYELVNNVSKADEQGGCLRTVYKDGTIVHRDNFADIRSRLGAM